MRGRLDTGDEILAVNGTECTSRASAIQMVRAAEDELQLKIYRYTCLTVIHVISLVEEMPHKLFWLTA